ncbi:MAG: GIY-YIG nuclease family protein [Pseudomonadota bacterium]
MSRDHLYTTYILASRPRGTLYIGVTRDIHARVLAHRSGRGSTFVARYRVHILVWYEQHTYVTHAIQREKSLKRWRREWKLELIERNNPRWCDLLTDMH